MTSKNIQDTEILLHDGSTMTVERMADEIHRLHNFRESRITDTNQDGTPAFTFEPWSDGHGIGFKVTRHEDGKVGYIAINPSTDTFSDGKFSPDVFVYTGVSDDIALDEPLHYYNIDFGDEDGEGWRTKGGFDPHAISDDLRDEIKAALEGDSNDAEHDALMSVADAFEITYNDPDALYDDDVDEEGEVDRREAEEREANMRADLESGECCTISDKGEVMLNGKLLATMTGDNRDEVFALMRDTFEKQGFYPNIYEINDHGNVTLLDSDDNAVDSWV